jgi:hypothetical protein
MTATAAPAAQELSYAEARGILAAFVRALAMDPYDAATILTDLDGGGTDRATLADIIDGTGYPNLVPDVLG